MVGIKDGPNVRVERIRSSTVQDSTLYFVSKDFRLVSFFTSFFSPVRLWI